MEPQLPISDTNLDQLLEIVQTAITVAQDTMSPLRALLQEKLNRSNPHSTLHTPGQANTACNTTMKANLSIEALSSRPIEHVRSQDQTVTQILPCVTPQMANNLHEEHNCIIMSTPSSGASIYVSAKQNDILARSIRREIPSLLPIDSVASIPLICSAQKAQPIQSPIKDSTQASCSTTQLNGLANSETSVENSGTIQSKELISEVTPGHSNDPKISANYQPKQTMRLTTNDTEMDTSFNYDNDDDSTTIVCVEDPACDSVDIILEKSPPKKAKKTGATSPSIPTDYTDEGGAWIPVRIKKDAKPYILPGRYAFTAEQLVLARFEHTKGFKSVLTIRARPFIFYGTMHDAQKAYDESARTFNASFTAKLKLTMHLCAPASHQLS